MNSVALRLKADTIRKVNAKTGYQFYVYLSSTKEQNEREAYKQNYVRVLNTTFKLK